MRVEWTETGKGELQFVVYAESREERLVLRVFREQQTGARMHLHGWTYGGGGIGPSSFNFGTITGPDA